MSTDDHSTQQQRYQQLRPFYGGELLPVIPTDAKLSQNSGLSSANLGKIPGKCLNTAEGVWCGLQKWPTRNTTEEEIDTWAHWSDHPVCARTRYFPAIDVDIDDPELAAKAREIIDAYMPETATRTRDGSPRVVKSYKLAEGEVADKKIILELPDGGGMVEILGDGQQVLLAGPHKSGAMQTLEGEPAEITVNQLRTVFVKLRRDLSAEASGGAGAGANSRSKPSGATNAALAGDTVTDETIADLRDALKHLDANDRDLWIAIGHALRSLPDDVGWPLFEKWSNTADDEFRSTPGKLRTDDWEKFNLDRTSYKSVFEKAQDAGWINPKKGSGDDLFKQDAVFEQDDDLFVSEAPGGEAQDVSERTPLGETLLPVKPFGYEMLPDGMEPWIRDAAERAQCPPDLIAVAAMVAASSLIAGKVRIYPKAKDNWCVTPNIWGMGISRPSVMKTWAMAEGASPLKPLIVAAKAKFKADLVNHQVNARFAKMQKEVDNNKVKAAMKAGDLSELNALKSAMQIAQETADDEPHEQRYIINDATVEMLGVLLNRNPDGLLVMRDELSGLLQSLDREDRSNDRAFYLECFDGSGSYTYDRIGRGTLHIENTTLSIVGGIQPSKIAPYIHHAITQGAGDDGLIQRFQLAVWPDDIKTWRNVDKAPDKKAQACVLAMFKKLNDMHAVENPVRFTPEAQGLFNKWREKLERMVRKSDIHPALESHFIKYRSLMPSLALIINEMDEGHGESVTLRSATKALKWCIYLKSHAGRVYGSAVNSASVGAKIIFERRAKLDAEFTVREIIDMHWVNLSDNEQVEAAIRELAECGYAYKVEVQKAKRGRPTTKFAWYEGGEA